MTSKRYYITTPIYYVNDSPHLGHAYTTIACDVLARFKRLDGYQVYFLTGTDEHGQKVQQAAEKAGVDPQSFTDRVSQNFRALGDLLNFSNDDFIRTTEERHLRAATAFWEKLVENGQIYRGTYSGWYAVRDEAYYDESELELRDGKRYAPSGAECVWTEEQSYFFRLSAWQEKLLDLYASQPDFVLPQARLNEVSSFVRGGLKDLSVSRTSFDWGIPVPGDPKHVMYVWIDALANYLTAIGYPDEGSESFQTFWPADLHMVGKDIVRFHAVYWPAMLMAAGLQPPKRIFAHGWWTIEGQKMSKSLGNVIAPSELVERYGVDATRFIVLREVPFGNDGNFSHDLAVARINADLANGLGNLAQRSLSMIYKNCGGALPQPGPFLSEDVDLLTKARGDLLAAVREELDHQRFHKALDLVWAVVNDANVYVDAQAPWALKKTDPARMGTVLYVLAETIRCLALILQPVMPEATAKILDQLAVPDDRREFTALSRDAALEAGTAIPEPKGAFPRIETAEGGLRGVG